MEQAINLLRGNNQFSVSSLRIQNPYIFQGREYLAGEIL